MATTGDHAVPEALTRRQSEVLRFIRRYVEQRGFPPSIREIADELDVNHNAVVGHLNAAARKGAIRRSSRTARGLTLTEGGRSHAKAK